MTSEQLRRLDRAIEKTADALKYSGPNGAKMYRDEVIAIVQEFASVSLRQGIYVGGTQIAGLTTALQRGGAKT